MFYYINVTFFSTMNMSFLLPTHTPVTDIVDIFSWSHLMKRYLQRPDWLAKLQENVNSMRLTDLIFKNNK